MNRFPGWILPTAAALAAVIAAILLIAALFAQPLRSLPGTARPTPTAFPTQAGFPCTDQLPARECAVLADLAGNEVRSPCDQAEDFGCTRGHLTRLSLKWAHVHGYTLTHIPDSIGDLSELSELNLFGNHYLEGPLPQGLFTLRHLEVLDIGDTKLSGPIPAQIGDLSSLHYLNLDNDQFTGQIPPEIARLQKLEYLHMFGNALTGPIPPELGSLGHLEELHLGHNALTGSIPSQLGDLSNLKRLYLHDNRLTGPIPPELANLSRLEDIVLRQNALTGPIPPDLLTLPALTRVDVSFTDLTGPVPSSVAPNLSRFWYHQTWLDEPDPGGDLAVVATHSAVARYENFDCARVTSIPPDECSALLDLYLPLAEHTDYYTRRGADIDHMALYPGVDWPAAPLFATLDPCTWFLLYCKDGHVTGLSLLHNFLPDEVPLPESLVNLKHLQFISSNISLPNSTQFCLPDSPTLRAWFTTLHGTPPLPDCE